MHRLQHCSQLCGRHLVYNGGRDAPGSLSWGNFYPSSIHQYFYALSFFTMHINVHVVAFVKNESKCLYQRQGGWGDWKRGEGRADLQQGSGSLTIQGGREQVVTWTSAIQQRGFLLNQQFTWCCVGMPTGHILEGLVNKCEQLYTLALKAYPFLSRTLYIRRFSSIS